MTPTPTALRLPVALLCLGLAGCATTASAPSEADPWERVNRSTYAFNDSLDRAVLKPVAKGYRRYVPQPLRTSVTNFLSNLAYPTTIANDLLQLKLMDVVSDTTRLVLNTTFGLGGLFDPASRAGLPRNDEDFGQTLGAWGVPSGPYVVIPLLGPSTLRDAPSLYVDYLTDGRHYIADNNIGFAFAGLSIVDLRARLIPVEAAIEGAFDPYALTRNAYLDRREYRVRDGNVEADEDLGTEDWPEEPGEPEEPESPGAPATPPVDADTAGG
ncbi:MAG: transporter [Proteobacteria bacterium]|nr:transporter [Pseudomonadota bacterium]